jgi:hypothetical protein
LVVARLTVAVAVVEQQTIQTQPQTIRQTTPLRRQQGFTKNAQSISS